KFRSQASAGPTAAQQRAVERVEGLLSSAFLRLANRQPSQEETAGILRLVAILPFDFDGPDRQASIAELRYILEQSDQAEATFDVLRQNCLDFMKSRDGADAPKLRSLLSSQGVKLKAPPSFVADVNALLQYSDRIRSHLEGYEKTEINNLEVKIDRRCT